MTAAVTWLLAAAAGIILAAAAYSGARAHGAAGALAPAMRAIAAGLLVALILDAPLGPLRAAGHMLALDASRSWATSPAAAWDSVRARAGREDSILVFGDSVRSARVPPEKPMDATSRVAPLVDRAIAAGRPVRVVTDGRLDDPDALAHLPRGSLVEVPDPDDRPDMALAAVVAPRTAVSGDTLDVRVSLTAGPAGSPARSLTTRLVPGSAAAVTQQVEPLDPFGEREVIVRVPVDSTEGARVLSLALGDLAGEAVPASDTLAVVVEVSPAAGAVVVSTSPDYDIRSMLGVLRGTTQLPTTGFLRVAPGEWRREGTLARVSEAAVRAAVRDAPIVVLHGDTAAFGAPANATGGPLLLMPTPPELQQSNWYPTGAPASPLTAALVGTPWDSLPPLTVGAEPPPAAWRGPEFRLNRGSQSISPIAGSDAARRRVVVAAAGFWRWEFRGGVAEDAYRALWGGLFDWLAEERADSRGVLPDDALLRAGEPVRWRRAGTTDSTITASIERIGSLAGPDEDGQGDAQQEPQEFTLRFGPDDAVAQSGPLESGRWLVRLPEGQVVLAVNPARELLPSRVTVQAGEVGAAPVVSTRRSARSVGWLYLVAVAALCAEWLLRRRAGLR